MSERVRIARKQKTVTELAPVQSDTLQLSSFTPEQTVDEVPPIVQEVLSSNGQPLDGATRDFMEPRFGHDFSQVRVHTDERAVESAQAVNALAYTFGQDVVFGQEQYVPETTEGKKLIAHELTHVVQQAQIPTSGIRRAESDTATQPVSQPATAVDADIEALSLAPAAKAAAKKLKEKHADIVFTSGRRTVAEQAHAMASNIVKSNNRKWIEQTYKSATELQKWVDDNPSATTVNDIAKGLETVMDSMSEHEQAKVSKHLSGEAFDVQPQDKDAEAIKKDIQALPGVTKFLDKEGGLIRWHVQFKKAEHVRHSDDKYEQEAEQVAEQIVNMAAVDAAIAGYQVQVRGFAGPAAIQLSPLSDTLTDLWESSRGNKGRIFDQLRAVSPVPDDIDVTAFLERTFKFKSDDLWLAQTIQKYGPETGWLREAFDERGFLAKTNKWDSESGPIEGSIGMSSGLVKGSTPTPITAYFFPGETDERALVIGGVHGSELSGVEVAMDLVKTLKDRFDNTKEMPHFTTIIVPELFPDSVALARKHPSTMKADFNIGREIETLPASIHPARQFPPRGKGLEDLERAGGLIDETGKRLKVDKTGEKLDKNGFPVPLLQEAATLMKLIERFRPTRIASIHGHHFSDDPKNPLKVPSTPPVPKRGVDAPGIFVDPRGGFDKKTDIAHTEEGRADDELALAIAREAHIGGAEVPGNWLGTPKEVKHYANPSHPAGFSLGDWGQADVPGTGSGARKGMTFITVEVAYDYDSSQDPSGARAMELQAQSDALMKQFLE